MHYLVVGTLEGPSLHELGVISLSKQQYLLFVFGLLLCSKSYL